MFYKHKYNDEKLEDMTITVFQVLDTSPPVYTLTLTYTHVFFI